MRLVAARVGGMVALGRHGSVTRLFGSVAGEVSGGVGPAVEGSGLALDARWGPSYVLNDGTHHPTMGFGTYKVGFVPASASAAASGAEASGAEASGASGRSASEIVGDALDTGRYRMLDCAQFYGNEREVGDAWRRSRFDREELYIASKVNHRDGAARG